MTDEILKAQAAEISRTTSTEGWKNIEEWIKGRVSNITAKIAAGETDMKVEKAEVKQDGSVKVTVVTIIKDEERHELRTWKMFLSKISDWETIARSK